MTDEQRVRRALDYEIEPWTPDPADLIRRGRRGAWVRRGAVAGAMVTVAGSVAGVSMAIGGPQLQPEPPVGGGGDSTPSPVPTVTRPMPREPRATPTRPPEPTISIPPREPRVVKPTERPPATPSLLPRVTRPTRPIKPPGEPSPYPTERPTNPPVPTVIDSGK